MEEIDFNNLYGIIDHFYKLSLIEIHPDRTFIIFMIPIDCNEFKNWLL
jgi:hypothetical protein